MLRRAFGSYNQPERRAIAEQAALIQGGANETVIGSDDLPYQELAEALATVRLLLGAEPRQESHA